MNVIRLIIFLLVSLGAWTFHSVLAQPVTTPTNLDLVGSWVVTQNSKPTDSLREILLQANGDAVLKHSTMSFKRRWKLSGGVLMILAAKDKFAPGPADHYKVVAFDGIKKQLDIRNELLRRDIRLVKSQ